MFGFITVYKQNVSKLRIRNVSWDNARRDIQFLYGILGLQHFYSIENTGPQFQIKPYSNFRS